jgi:hypothetical protein
MKLTTTLAKIRACSPCASGWKKLVTALGGIDAYGEDTEINLLKILETNGVQDTLWCLRATEQENKRTALELAIAFAEETLSIFESKYPDDNRPRMAIQAAKDYNAGLIDIEAIRTARHAAADAAAYAAYAAYAAAAKQKMIARQAEIIRMVLE